MQTSENRSGVLVVGELNMDLILSDIAAFPELSKEIIAEKAKLTMGSSAAIFANNLTTLGTKVEFIGKIGGDRFGEQILRSLSAKGIRTDRITRSARAQTGITVVLSYKNERANITYPGAMVELEEKEISDEALLSSRHLHVSSLFMQPGLKKGIIHLLQRAKDAHLTISLDTQWDPAEEWDVDWQKLLSLVDFFMPNLEELKSITKQDNIESCIRRISEFAHTVVVKNGVSGSVLWSKGNFFHQKAFINSEVMDTIGAGDSYNAGFIYNFLRGKGLEECMELGAICGAVNTTEYGGITAFSSKQNVRDIALKRFNCKINDL